VRLPSAWGRRVRLIWIHIGPTGLGDAEFSSRRGRVGGGGLSIDRSTKPRFEVREIDMAAAIAVLASFLLARIPPPSRVVVVVVVVVGIIAWD